MVSYQTCAPDQLLTSMAKTASAASVSPSGVDKEKLKELLSQIFNFVTKQSSDEKEKNGEKDKVSVIP